MLDYRLSNGLLESEPSGGSVWNPWQSGVTVLSLRQYNRYQSYFSEARGKLDGDVHAVELGLLYDNTDFPINPSKGSSQYLAYHYNPDSDSDKNWTYLEFEASKYFSFGSSHWARQRIVALNFWTSYSPSWTVNANEDGSSTIAENPPFTDGATLGGYYRMKGFRGDRFHDKAAVYAAAEYRYTLDYNPVKNVSWLSFLHLDWFQVVGFVEAGRVGPEYDTDSLFKDVKTDFGVGLRAMTGGIIVRFSVSHSDEGTNMWAMVGHPF
jgi:outer membrane protein assembly factor BamA